MQAEGVGAAHFMDTNSKTCSTVIHTYTCQMIYFPLPGLVDTADLKPTENVKLALHSFALPHIK